MVQAEVTLPVTLHARPAAQLVALTASHKATIRVGCQGRFVDAKSILGLLSLGAPAGTVLTVQAEGTDAAHAVDQLVELLKGFQPE